MVRKAPSSNVGRTAVQSSTMGKDAVRQTDRQPDSQTDIDADRQAEKKRVQACGKKTSNARNSNISFMHKWIQEDFIGMYVKQF